MRVVLVFPPKAGATYVPLGIASLAPYIKARVADADVRLIDLNIALWHLLAIGDPEGHDLLAFTQGGTSRRWRFEQFECYSGPLQPG